MNQVPDFLSRIKERERGTLPNFLGFEWTRVEPGIAEGYFEVKRQHFAANGFLHAGTVVTLADSACGYGCVSSLPEGATGFATLEIKSNFLGTARDGIVKVVAELVHGGRSTQVWDAIVTTTRDGAELTIALFRCTQQLLYPRPK
tara:strand:- start:239 stop:673 length:435 start_codon:yes stop_codon:yes gene_type:complete